MFMRLSEEERIFLKKCAKRIDEEAEVFLFGSRVDDEKRGGDIDLLVVSKKFDRKKVRQLRLDFFKRFGEQKIDIVVDDGGWKEPFHRIIRDQAVPL